MIEMYEEILNDFSGKFGNYYYQYLIVLENKLKDLKVEYLFKYEDDKKKCYHQVIKGVLDKLIEVNTYSLIDFYHTLREKNVNLSYSEFHELLKKPVIIEEFNDLYPVAVNRCNTIINNYLERIKELFNLLTTYKFDLLDFVNIKNKSCLRITDIDIFKGDFHKDTYVAVLTLHNHKVVIKKRSTLGEQLMNIPTGWTTQENVELVISNGCVI